MRDTNGSSQSHFAATFPQRFAQALADAQGAIAGITASAAPREGALIDPESLGRLHELYRLRIELEIETAGVLWRTAEVVSAMADALHVLSRRRQPAPVPPARWLQGLPASEIEARRSGTVVADGAVAHGGHWQRFAGRSQAEGTEPAADAA